MRDVRDAIAYPAGLNYTCIANVVPVDCRGPGTVAAGEQCQRGVCSSSDPSWTVGYATTVELVRALYDDDRIVDENYAGVSRWHTILAGQLTNLSTPQPFVLLQQPIGDWAAPRPDPERSADHDESTFMFVYGSELLASWARRRGNSSDLARIQRLLTTVKAHYHANFYDNKTGAYRDKLAPQETDGYMPLSQMMALRLGVVAPENRQALFDFLLQLVRGEQPGPSALYPNHTGWGIVTQRYMYETLSEFGRTDVGLQLLLQSDFPSVGRWVDQGATMPGGPTEYGATTLWETFGNNAR